MVEVLPHLVHHMNREGKPSQAGEPLRNQNMMNQLEVVEEIPTAVEEELIEDGMTEEADLLIDPTVLQSDQGGKANVLVKLGEILFF